MALAKTAGKCVLFKLVKNSTSHNFAVNAIFSKKFAFSNTMLIVHFASSDQDSCPNIISRSQWSARKAISENYLIPPLQYVVIYDTATSELDQEWFLIDGNGNVYEGVGLTKEGAHTYGYNKKSAGLAFIGSYQDKEANEKMLTVAHKLITCGKSEGVLRPDVKVITGLQIISIISPGNELYNQIQN